jgi:hypothetical protein
MTHGQSVFNLSPKHLEAERFMAAHEVVRRFKADGVLDASERLLIDEVPILREAYLLSLSEETGFPLSGRGRATQPTWGDSPASFGGDPMGGFYGASPYAFGHYGNPYSAPPLMFYGGAPVGNPYGFVGSPHPSPWDQFMRWIQDINRSIHEITRPSAPVPPPRSSPPRAPEAQRIETPPVVVDRPSGVIEDPPEVLPLPRPYSPAPYEEPGGIGDPFAPVPEAAKARQTAEEQAKMQQQQAAAAAERKRLEAEQNLKAEQKMLRDPRLLKFLQDFYYDTYAGYLSDSKMDESGLMNAIGVWNDRYGARHGKASMRWEDVSALFNESRTAYNNSVKGDSGILRKDFEAMGNRYGVSDYK